MPQRIVRSKSRKFAHAAAAMGEFWERARRREAQRIERLQQALRLSAPSALGTPRSRPASAAID